MFLKRFHSCKKRVLFSCIAWAALHDWLSCFDCRYKYAFQRCSFPPCIFQCGKYKDFPHVSHTSWDSFYRWSSRLGLQTYSFVHCLRKWDPILPSFVPSIFQHYVHPLLGSGHISPCGNKEELIFLLLVFLHCLTWWASIGKMAEYKSQT